TRRACAARTAAPPTARAPIRRRDRPASAAGRSCGVPRAPPRRVLKKLGIPWIVGATYRSRQGPARSPVRRRKAPSRLREQEPLQELDTCVDASRALGCGLDAFGHHAAAELAT